MKVLVAGFVILFLTACGDGDGSNAVLDDSPSPGAFEATVGSMHFETSGRCRFIGSEEEFFFVNDFEDTPGSIKSGVQSNLEPGEKLDVLLTLNKVTEDGYINIEIEELLTYTVHQSGAKGSGTAIVSQKSGGKMDVDYTPKDFDFEVTCR